MERGVISLTVVEAQILRSTLISQGCAQDSLLAKLDTAADSQEYTGEFIIEISEENAETILDCMPVPSKDTDPNLTSSRIKIQAFLAKSRFGE